MDKTDKRIRLQPVERGFEPVRACSADLHGAPDWRRCMSTDAEERIFETARRLSAPQQSKFVDRECHGNLPLRESVERLLSAERQAEHFLRGVTIAEPCTAAADVTTSVPATTAEGMQLGRYMLIEQLGEGGFGTVWLAEQLEPVVRRVALKVIKVGMDTKQVVARFEAERQALAVMEHPHIARVFDAGQTETGRPYFVMELTPGPSIVEHCAAHGLSIRDRLDLFAKVCDAIQHAHQKGVIHRDIKSKNVLVTVSDGDASPKVIDFGIAKATGLNAAFDTVATVAGQMYGSPAYMSPEQSEMSQDIDTRTDIYSLGILLYEMLTGTTPFDAEALMSMGFSEMCRVIREDEPERPSSRIVAADTAAAMPSGFGASRERFADMLRGDLDCIVMRCLEKDRSLRYPSASALAADVRRFLADEPVAARPRSRGYTIRKFVSRHRSGVVMAGIAAAALVLGTAGIATGFVRALHQKDIAESAQADAQRELLRANEVKQLLASTLTSVRPEIAGSADTPMLREVLNHAAARVSDGSIDDDLIVAELRSTIGTTFWKLGDLEHAEDHLEQAIALFDRNYGEQHPETLQARMNLTAVWRRQGKAEQAESTARAVLAASRHTYGPDHQQTYTASRNLALCLISSGKPERALELLEPILDEHERRYGKDHQRTIVTLSAYAGALHATNNLEAAGAAFKDTADRFERLSGHPEDSRALRARMSAASCQIRLGDAEAAADQLTQMLPSIIEVYGRNHPLAVTTYKNIATACHYMKDLPGVAEWRGRIAEALEEIHGSTHDLTLRAKRDYAQALESIGHMFASVAVLRSSYDAVLTARPEGDRES
ncbi:MAG: serine/threonine-protein kinase, partial [Planctomycetota bacterium]